MNRIQQLHSYGQSIWLDFIERSMVQSGELQRLVDEGITGVTSNPTIFQQAISKSAAYSDDLRQLSTSNRTTKEIFESLAIADIQAGADAVALLSLCFLGHLVLQLHNDQERHSA